MCPPPSLSLSSKELTRWERIWYNKVLNAEAKETPASPYSSKNHHPEKVYAQPDVTLVAARFTRHGPSSFVTARRRLRRSFSLNSIRFCFLLSHWGHPFRSCLYRPYAAPSSFFFFECVRSTKTFLTKENFVMMNVWKWCDKLALNYTQTTEIHQHFGIST